MHFYEELIRFSKSLREKTYFEWWVHKTLTEAGGVGDTVYILPARGGGKGSSPEDIAEMYAHYKAAGKDVRLIRKSNLPEETLMGSVKHLREIGIIRDKDVIAEMQTYDYFGLKWEKRILENIYYKYDPSFIRPETYNLTNNPYYGMWTDNKIYDTHMNAVKVIKEECTI